MGMKCDATANCKRVLQYMALVLIFKEQLSNCCLQNEAFRRRYNGNTSFVTFDLKLRDYFGFKQLKSSMT
jgi:hypothetical protein